MQYRCPSCHLYWKDNKFPEEQITHPLCTFCSMPHTQKELLNWQMDHINDVPSEFTKEIIKHFYRFVELEIKLLKGQMNELHSSSDSRKS